MDKTGPLVFEDGQIIMVNSIWRWRLRRRFRRIFDGVLRAFRIEKETIQVNPQIRQELIQGDISVLQIIEGGKVLPLRFREEEQERKIVTGR